MAVAKSLRIIGAWGVSRQTLLILILAVIVVCAAIVGWRYAYLDYQLSSAEHSPNVQASSLEGSLLDTTMPSATNIQVQTTSGGIDNTPPVIKINNQAVDMPASGEVHQVIQDSGGKTVVDVSVQSNASDNSSTSSSTSVQLSSTSESTVESSHQAP